MSAIDEIMSSVPVNQIAATLGVNPAEVHEAAEAALPALLGGMEANAADPAGAESLAEATQQHSPALFTNGAKLADIDQQDGAAIAHHIFGPKEDQVINQLGGLGGNNNELIRKLIPILAPIVMAWLAKKLTERQSAPADQPDQPAADQQQGGGLLGGLLGKILTGATAGDNRQRSGGLNSGGIIGDLLGGLLGHGRR